MRNSVQSHVFGLFVLRSFFFPLLFYNTKFINSVDFFVRGLFNFECIFKYFPFILCTNEYESSHLLFFPVAMW